VKTKMTYLLTLSETHSARLEQLARKERLKTPELIEKIVTGYLESVPAIISGADGQGTSNLQNTGVNYLYKWDEEKGIITFTPTNKRVFIATARSWDALEQDLFMKLLKGAAPLLTEMGAAYGRATALDYRSLTSNPEDLTAYFEHLGLAAGWGLFSTTGDLERGSKITVRVRDCVFCRSRNASMGRRDPCYLLMGVCKGTADTVFDSAHYVEETKCCARGDDFCEILIRKSAESEKPSWSMGANPSSDVSLR
jgi:predicted hydrocarbon binding protein